MQRMKFPIPTLLVVVAVSKIPVKILSTAIASVHRFAHHCFIGVSIF